MGLPHLGILDILAWTLLCWGQGCPVHCRILPSIPGFYPLDASSVKQTCLQTMPKSFPQVRDGGQNYTLVESYFSRGSAKPLGRPSFVYVIANILVMYFLLSSCHQPYAQTSSMAQATYCQLFCTHFQCFKHSFRLSPPEKHILSPWKFKLFKASLCTSGPSEPKPLGTFLTSQCYLKLSILVTKELSFLLVLCDKSLRTRVLTQEWDLVQWELHKHVGQFISKSVSILKFTLKDGACFIRNGISYLTNNFFHLFYFNCISNLSLFFCTEFFSSSYLHICENHPTKKIFNR